MTDPAIAGYGVVDGPPLPYSADQTVIANISGAPGYPVAVPLSAFEAAFPIVSGTTPISGGTASGVVWKNGSVVGVGPATTNTSGGLSLQGTLNGVNIFAGAASAMGWSGRAITQSPADGQLQISNNAVTNSFVLTAAGASATPNLQLGGAASAAPVAQTFSVQNVVAGTTNTAGASRNYDGSQGTGLGVGGSHVFRVAPAGSTGSAVNALATAVTIDSTKTLILAGELKLNNVRAAGVLVQGGSVQMRDSAGTLITVLTT